MHPALEPLDPFRLDRAIAETAPRARRWRRALRDGRGLDLAPFEIARWACGRAAYRAVEELDETDPMREPLARWVYRLTQQRVNQPAIAWVAFERRGREVVLDGPDRRREPVASALAEALREPRSRKPWLDAFCRTAREAGRAAALLEQRRQEVASRLGLSSPEPIESCCEDAPALAEHVLDLTADALGELAPRDLSEWIGIASAETAPEGWPGTLSDSTLGAWFRDSDLLRSLDLDPGRFPESLNPASTLRALARLGAAWVDATAPSDQPFVLAHDPFGLGRMRMGALLASLPSNRAFAAKTLGVPRSKRADHERALARAALLELRAIALRVRLAPAAREGEAAFARAFEDECARALGFVPPKSVMGALFRLRDDDAQRLAGLLLAAAQARVLRDTHDEDWYRSPRAIDELRALAARPPETRATTESLRAGASTLVASLTERF